MIEDQTSERSRRWYKRKEDVPPMTDEGWDNYSDWLSRRWRPRRVVWIDQAGE